MTASNTQFNSVHPQQFTLQLGRDLILESGEVLTQPKLAYQVWGKLNETRSNVVWVCHALTGNHLVHEWWDGLFGEGKCFDPEDYCIISVNVLGSCYGSEGPIATDSGKPSTYLSFPLVTIRDIVQGLEAVRLHLGIDQVAVLIGASVGGQQVLEWALQVPRVFQRIIPIATNVKHSPFGIAYNESQRLALEADASFRAQLSPEGGTAGLIAARSIGMLSYRTYRGYELTQSENTNRLEGFKAASYQAYQGLKLSKRFNAYSYWYLSKAMDSHNISRNRKGSAELLKELEIPALVVGIDSDALFPLSEQQFIAEHLPQSELVTLSSDFGHDGFLVEFDILSEAITAFLTKEEPYKLK